MRSPVERFLARAESPARPFDLVFLDPPYDVPIDRGRGRAGAAARAPWLIAPGATRRRRTAQGGRHRSRLPDGWGTEKERAYGDTLLVVAIA